MVTRRITKVKKAVLPDVLRQVKDDYEALSRVDFSVYALRYRGGKLMLKKPTKAHAAVDDSGT